MKEDRKLNSFEEVLAECIRYCPCCDGEECMQLVKCFYPNPLSNLRLSWRAVGLYFVCYSCGLTTPLVGSSLML